MKWRKWMLSLSVTITSGGCSTLPELQFPPHNTERLVRAPEIKLAVAIDVMASLWDTQPTPERSAAARDRMIGTIASRLASEGIAVTVSDARPQVPWRPGSHLGLPREPVEPYFIIPACALPEAVTPPAARLEVVAIQVMKTPFQRLDNILGGNGLVLFAPYAFAAHEYSLLYGSGVTAVRFCLFQAGDSEPAWTYAEWFHAGSDLREPARADSLVSRALDSYRAALARKP